MLDSPVALFPVDEARFGIKSARSTATTVDDLKIIENFCSTEQVIFNVLRTDTRNISLIQGIENCGYRLMDTLVFYRVNLPLPILSNDDKGVTFRIANHRDTESILKVAAEAFTGYFGHYHADPRLEKSKCDEGYVDWARKCLTDKSAAEAVLIVEYYGELAGFVTLKLVGESDSEIVVGGISRKFQGRGYYRRLLEESCRWFANQNRETTTVSTQIINMPVQRVWQKLGFEIHHSVYTFHKWYTE